MTITVTSVDDTTAEFNPVWDYGQAENSQEETQTSNTDETTNSTSNETENN